MSNIRRRATSPSAIAVSALSILLMGLLASIPSLNIPSFSQEEENNDDDDTTLILSGRINSILMPTMADTNNDVMNNSTVMPQMMNNSSTAPAAANDSAASRAMRYSMARDIVWLLSGDWILASNSNDNSSNSTTFDVEFIKVST